MRVGCLGYATEQGLGMLMKSFFDAGVITDPMIWLHGHPSRPNHLEWYPSGTQTCRGHAAHLDLKGIDVMLFFETPFDWSLPIRCKDRGIRTALVPMYEWTPRRPPSWFDVVICPSALDYDYFCMTSTVGFCYKCVHIPIPVRTDLWKPRTKALRFLHNAGHLGHREHKGTRQLLEAVKFIKSDAEITVRSQKDVNMVSLVYETKITSGRVQFQTDLPYEQLWDGHDVYIAPEKFNGLSLPLQEARAAGMVVMTSDRYPHNTWLPKEPLIPVTGYGRVCISQHYLEFDEAIIEPMVIAATIDSWYGRDISAISESGRVWAEQNSWPALKDRWLEALS